MTKYLITGLFMMTFAGCQPQAEELSDRIKFASEEKAKELLTTEDKFTDSWSQFDIDSRMKKQNSSKEELLQYISSQVRPWTPEEQEKLLAVVGEIERAIAEKGMKISFPGEIYLIKTTAEEEGGAGGYTRGSYIVLKDNVVSAPEDGLKKTLVHELFHVLTRNNPEFREEMYSIIGFELMNEVGYPESIRDYRITNPDSPQTDSYIRLTVNGEAGEYMIVLYAKEDYSEGSFFDYLNVGFIKLEGDAVKKVHLIEGEPQIYGFEDVSGFFEQVGKNTQYIIHAEEIMADNFTFAVLGKEDLPDPEIVSEIVEKLK